MFENLNAKYGEVIRKYRRDPLPSMLAVPCWEFDACLEMLRADFGRTGLADDLDPLAERQLCERAARENGVAAVFVLGFPLAARPFYTARRGSQGAAGSFDLLFQGPRNHYRRAAPASPPGSGIRAPIQVHRSRKLRKPSGHVRPGNAAPWRVRHRPGTPDVSGTQPSQCPPGRSLSPGPV